MPHYYDEKQPSPLRPFKILIEARGRRVELWSGSGVFSLKRLDKGTRLLLDTAVIEGGWRVHDFGCGIGVVGTIVKLAHPSCDVVSSDVSERAVQLARMNAKELGLDLDVVRSDGYENIKGAFDAILFNPPYVAGRQEILRLIGEAYEHLRPGGLLQIVARHQKGGKTLMKHLEERFKNCDDSRKGSGYRVYICRK